MYIYVASCNLAWRGRIARPLSPILAPPPEDATAGQNYPLILSTTAFHLKLPICLYIHTYIDIEKDMYIYIYIYIYKYCFL